MFRDWLSGAILKEEFLVDYTKPLSDDAKSNLFEQFKALMNGFRKVVPTGTIYTIYTLSHPL